MKTLELDKFDFTLDSRVKKDFEFIKGGVEGVLLFGSAARGESNERSDVDVCLVKPKNKEVLIRVFERLGDKYDVKIFEDLPLYIKMDIIKGHKTIFGNEPHLSYYFYGFRKEWDAMRHRVKRNQFSSMKEMLTNRRRWLNEKKISGKI